MCFEDKKELTRDKKKMTKSISSLFPAPRRHQTQEELRLTGRGASFSYKHKVTEQVSLSPASPPLPLHFCMVSSLACALLKKQTWEEWELAVLRFGRNIWQKERAVEYKQVNVLLFGFQY